MTEPVPATSTLPGRPALPPERTLLFTELLLIRWIPANVIYVGFFSNFLLMGSFLGIGIGILLGSGGRRAPSPAFPALLLLVVLLVARVQLNVHG